MAVRTGHGTGRGKPRVEVLPADELPVGRAAPPAAESGPVERHPDGRIAGTEAARALGRLSAVRRAERAPKKWAERFGLGRLIEGLKDEATIAPFLPAGEKWLRDQCAFIVENISDGVLSPAVWSMAQTAAQQHILKCYFFDLATRSHFAFDVLERDAEGNPKRIQPNTELALVAARLGDSSRQNLLAAHELAAREAASRPRRHLDPMARIRALAEGKKR
jgi:hypothetical protein